MRVPVENGDHRRRPLGREDRVEDRRVSVGEALAGTQRPEDEVRRGEDDEVGGDPRRCQLVVGGTGLGDRHPGRHQRHLGVAPRRRHGGDSRRRGRLGGAARALRGHSGTAAKALVDRTRREAEVGRFATRPPQPAERVQQRPLEVLAEGRLPGDATRLADPDRRGRDRLVRAALGRERDPRRGSDEDRLAACVDAEAPGLERPADERVVERPDRQQRPAVARPGRRPALRAARPGSPRRSRARCAGPAVLAPADQRVGVVGEPVDPLARVPDRRRG